MWRSLLPLLIISFLGLAAADEHSHKYNLKEEVVVWVNTVGPFNNRQETYSFYHLPYCRGSTELEHHHETLGEVLQGLELVNAGIEAKFRKNVEESVICSTVLDVAQVEKFRYAIANSYWYQMFVDDLPVWGFVGFLGEGKLGETVPYLYTHQEFLLSYNDDQIIEVKLTNGNPVRLDLSGPLTVSFSYEVKWQPTSIDFAHRFDKYLDTNFFEHKIHWFSIFNSFMMVVFLMGLVVVILLRTLRKDFARYDKKEIFEDLERDLGDDYGWKQVHGDVFRRPNHLTVLAAFLGTGLQLVILTLALIIYTILGDLYTERSTILTAAIFLYALASVISGYYSGSFYTRYGGKHWIRNMMVTVLLWPSVVSIVTILNNIVALYYSSSRAIHFGTLVAIIAIWLFLVYPLTLLGTVIGKNWSGQPDFPCRVNPIPRQIPEKKWYANTLVIIFLGGILPFGSIFIEMYFVFTSFWQYKIYYVYGFMLLVFLILAVVTGCVTVVNTYFLLNSEDHRWPWTSFLASGTTALYVFLYGVYYFFVRTKMSGFFQIFFYFSYTFCVCFGLFIALGTIGFLSAELFVFRIFKNLKFD